MPETSRRTTLVNFREVYNKGKVLSNQDVVLHFMLREGPGQNRAGFSVSKRVSSAVHRNKLKRLLREAYRANAQKLICACDLVLIAKPSLEKRSWIKVNQSLLDVLRRAGLVRKK